MKIKEFYAVAKLEDGIYRQIPLTKGQANSTLEHIQILQGGELRVLTNNIKKLKHLITEVKSG